MQALAHFAHHGDPHAKELGVKWPEWPAMLKFDATLAHKVISVE